MSHPGSTLPLMALARHAMSADEFLALPPSDWHRQLIDGELVVTEPKVSHQRIVIWLTIEIGNWTRGNPDRGEVIPMAARLSDRDVFVPDLLWLRSEHRPPGGAGHLEVAPDLVVEVRSPSTWQYDQGHKRRVYEAAGVTELWLVDHLGGTVEVWRRSSPEVPAFDEHHVLRAGDTLTTPLLPGLSLGLAALLALGTEHHAP